MKTLTRWTIAIVFLAAVIEVALAVEPFNGKDLAGWKLRGKAEQSKWKVGTAALDPDNPARLRVTPGGSEMVNDIRPGVHGVDIYTEEKYGDARIDVEIMVPARSNSGVYPMGEYEIQVLDSYGKREAGPGDMGGVYGVSAPKENASLKPGQWQKMTIEYCAPKFDAAGKKTVNARIVKVVLNGKVIQENVEVMRGTGGGVTGREAPTGPLMFQGNHGAVAYRNIKITPLGGK